MRGAEPNAGHRALARLDPEPLITQNVDGLHEPAGSRRLVALHGRIAEVVCLVRGDVAAPRPAGPAGRAQPGLRRAARRGRGCGPTATSTSTTPAGFVVPRGAECGGVLKPTWSSSARTSRPTGGALLRRVDALAANGGALLVAGSSLTVMSGFRFVRRARAPGPRW